MQLPPHMLLQAAHSALGSLKPDGKEPDGDESEDQENEDNAEQMDDPRNQDEDGTCMYLDKGMFGSHVAKGDEVMIRGTVKSLGSKIGVVPDEIVKDHEEQEEGEEEDGSEEHGDAEEDSSGKNHEFQTY